MSESWGESEGEPVLCAVANVTALARETQSANVHVSERIFAVDTKDNEMSRA